MKGCMNVIWHFPLFGFLMALLYALGGLLWCCTIVFYPIGLGFFQISKYLFSPFTTSLVTREDLKLVRYNDANEEVNMSEMYSKIIGILFLPFGLIWSVFAIFHILGCLLSLIGIPCAYVWLKALPAMFNPTNKVCVPIEVANEIERIKSSEKLAAYTGNDSYKQEPPKSDITSNNNISTNTVVTTGNSLLDEVRNYSDGRLSEICDNAVMFNSTLVDMCVKEVAIRKASVELMPKVIEFSDEKLNEILSSPSLYSEEIIYCSEKVKADREKVRLEELAQQKAQERKEREEKLKAEQLEQEKRRKEDAEKAKMWWTLHWWKVACGLVVLLLVGIILYINTNDRYLYLKGYRIMKSGNSAAAVRYFEKVNSVKTVIYAAAKYNAYQAYMDLGDKASAGRVLTESIAGMNWDYYDDAYSKYCWHCEMGDLAPHIPQNFYKAAMIYETSQNSTHKELAGAMYLKANSYEKAYEILSYINTPIANGYLGIMYMFGKGVTRDVDNAWKHMNRAPDVMPFVMLKGDLLIMKGNILKANDFYKIAADNSYRDDIQTRYKVTSNYVKAHNKAQKSWNANWSTFSLNNGTGTYTGENPNNGWGVYKFKSGEFRVGKFVNINGPSPGISINVQNYFSVGEMTGKTSNYKNCVVFDPFGNYKIYKNGKGDEFIADAWKEYLDVTGGMDSVDEWGI